MSEFIDAPAEFSGGSKLGAQESQLSPIHPVVHLLQFPGGSKLGAQESQLSPVHPVLHLLQLPGGSKLGAQESQMSQFSPLQFHGTVFVDRNCVTFVISMV